MENIENIVCPISVNAQHLQEAFRRMSVSMSQADRAFRRVGNAMSRARQISDDFGYRREGLTGEAYVEGWDPDFDPRSVLIKDL